MATAFTAAVRLPGWRFALALDAVAGLGGYVAVRWGPADAVALALAASSVLIAAATASLLDDDVVGLTCTAPLTLRRRTLARLALGLLVAAAAGAAVVAALIDAVPRDQLDGPIASMVLAVAVGAAAGVASARIRPDLPAAIPAALLLVAGWLVAQQLTIDVVAGPWTRTAYGVLLAGAVVLATTRDRAAPRRLPHRRGPIA